MSAFSLVPLRTGRSYALVIVLLLSSACAKSRHLDFQDAPIGTGQRNQGPNAEELPVVDLGAEDAAYLFDSDEVHTFDLRLNEEDLAFLDADPKAEQYVPGELIFEGQRVKPVGIRYKGSTGAFVGCLSDSFLPPSGHKVCPRLSLKVKVDYGDPEAKFYGQKKLLFHAMNRDRSLMRERLGYGLYREMGVHASRTAHVRLLINGELSGIYLLVEEVDGRFTRSRFDDGGEGNLYKEVWPVDDDPERYRAALETNRDEDPSVDKMMALARALSEADDESLPSVVEAWMDTDYVARFVAVDRAIRHDDGPFHWYCRPAMEADASWRRQHLVGNSACGNHNYYWYEDTQADRLWPVPWDLDDAMNGSIGGFTLVRSAWDDLSYNCTQLLGSGLSGSQMPITCDPLQRAWALGLREKVHAATRELVEGPLSERAVERKLTRWAEQIAPIVEEMSAMEPPELTMNLWVAAMDALKTTLGQLRAAAPTGEPGPNRREPNRNPR